MHLLQNAMTPPSFESLILVSLAHPSVTQRKTVFFFMFEFSFFVLYFNTIIFNYPVEVKRSNLRRKQVTRKICVNFKPHFENLGNFVSGGVIKLSTRHSRVYKSIPHTFVNMVVKKTEIEKLVSAGASLRKHT